MTTAPSDPSPAAVLAPVSRHDDLHQHGRNALQKLVSITLVLSTVTALLDRDTKYDTSRDYLEMIRLSAGLLVLSEFAGHLRHRKRLLT